MALHSPVSKHGAKPFSLPAVDVSWELALPHLASGVDSLFIVRGLS